MAVSLSPFAGAGWQFFDNNGVILSGGKLYTYAAGTTSLATTYTSSTGSTANTNPIILNSSGRLANEIWLTTGLNYKFILKTSADVLIGTWDNIPAGTTDVADLQAALASSTGAGMIGYIANDIGTAVATTVQAKLRETVSVFDFMTAAQVADAQSYTASIDVTSAFLSAIQSYSAQRNIYVPPGAYKITSTLALGINKQLIGAGSALVTLKFDSSDLYCITGDAYTRVEGITIQKIVAASRTGIASYTPTTANGWHDGSLNDVVITDFDVAIGSTQGLTQGLMFNNTYENVRIYNAVTGVEMGSGSNCNTFINCAFWNCGTAVNFNNVTSQTLIGCGFEGSTSYDFIVDASYNISFKTCYFEPAKGGTFTNSTGSFDTCHSTAFSGASLQFITYSSNSTISVTDFTDYNIGGVSTATQWYARSGDSTGYAYKRNVRVRTGTAKADELAIAAPFVSSYGTNVSLANGATQTIVALSGAASGIYQVYATIRASGGPSNWASFGTVIWDTTGARFNGSNGAAFPISVSGTNVIVTNGTGATAVNVDYGYLRIGP